MKIRYTYRPVWNTSIEAARVTGCFISLNNWKKLLISFKLCLFVPSSYYTKWVGKKSGIPLNVDMYYVLGNGVISLKILPQAQIMLYIIYWVSIYMDHLYDYLFAMWNFLCDCGKRMVYYPWFDHFIIK